MKEFIEKIPRYMTDFWAFVKECLGHERSEELGWGELTESHKELCRFLQFDANKFKLVLMPRYSLKSCLGTVGLSLWELARNPNLRILIYSDSSTKAEGFLLGIKNHILGKAGNSKFREFFPEWETGRVEGKWNENAVIIRPRTNAEKEPSIDTAGIETTKVGCHYDLIIFDDIVSDLNITTKEQMDKVYDCYKKSLSLLKPGGRIVMIGTRWHHSDAYGRIIQESHGDWGFFIKKAEAEGEYPFGATGLTKEFVEAQRVRLGSYLFSCLMMNEPIDPTDAWFPKDGFCFYRDIDISNMVLTCTCDPAGEGEDFTAITVVGTDNTMRMFVLDAVNKHLKAHEIVNEIIKLSYKWKFTKLGIETNFFEGLLERELQLALETERMNPQFIPFGIETFRAGGCRGEGKSTRILSLQPYFERQHILFPGTSVETLRNPFNELAYQMMQYTTNHQPLHDDLVDSLAYHVKMMRRGGGECKTTIPQNTIAEVIEKERQKLNALQRRLPRKYRYHYEPVF